MATRGWGKAVREFLYGMTSYEFEQHALDLRASTETIFMLVTFGDMLGVPILPPYYGLRLLAALGLVWSLRPVPVEIREARRQGRHS